MGSSFLFKNVFDKQRHSKYKQFRRLSVTRAIVSVLLQLVKNLLVKLHKPPKSDPLCNQHLYLQLQEGNYDDDDDVEPLVNGLEIKWKLLVLVGDNILK